MRVLARRRAMAAATAAATAVNTGAVYPARKAGSYPMCKDAIRMAYKAACLAPSAVTRPHTARRACARLVPRGGLRTARGEQNARAARAVHSSQGCSKGACPAPRGNTLRVDSLRAARLICLVLMHGARPTMSATGGAVRRVPRGSTALCLARRRARRATVLRDDTVEAVVAVAVVAVAVAAMAGAAVSVAMVSARVSRALQADTLRVAALYLKNSIQQRQQPSRTLFLTPKIKSTAENLGVMLVRNHIWKSYFRPIRAYLRHLF